MFSSRCEYNDCINLFPFFFLLLLLNITSVHCYISPLLLSYMFHYFLHCRRDMLSWPSSPRWSTWTGSSSTVNSAASTGSESMTWKHRSFTMTPRWKCATMSPSSEWISASFSVSIFTWTFSEVVTLWSCVMYVCTLCLQEELELFFQCLHSSSECRRSWRRTWRTSHQSSLWTLETRRW